LILEEMLVIAHVDMTFAAIASFVIHLDVITMLSLAGGSNDSLVEKLL
jgi:hypothetical protein